ncbi:MAG: hypothetical protein ACREQ5_40995 [Candidatus Dormibacteria bacterium]
MLAILAILRKLVPLRDWLYLALAVALVGGYYVHGWSRYHAGYRRATLDAQTAQAALQARVDTLSAASNAALEKQYSDLAGVLAPYALPHYTLPTDCGIAPPDLVRAVNSAHHAH